jgi:16S rRNA (cytosine967-C5)-methyltransferase
MSSSYYAYIVYCCLRLFTQTELSLLDAETAATVTLPALQRSILAAAAQHVGPGGTLVYATCSLLAAENQDVAAWFDSEACTNGSSTDCKFEPWPFANDSISDDQKQQQQQQQLRSMPHCKLLLPSEGPTDGFFIARWKRCD